MMKRWMAWPLALALVLSLCACTQQTAESPEDQEGEYTGTIADPAEEEAKEPEPEPEPEPDVAVPASQAVDPSWFADAVFVGDSVSVMLETYNGTEHTLGDPTFLCSVSLSQTNVKTFQAGNEGLPEYPKGSGQRPALLDSIAATGAKKVYILLGVNCLANGVDRTSQDLVTLVGQIRERLPESAILLESVTPMTQDSPRADQALNNTVIQTYNETIKDLCRQNGWYYVNVAEALSDEGGFLRADYSGDKAMGIHLNYDGAAAWADYLLTHVPETLK